MTPYERREKRRETARRAAVYFEMPGNQSIRSCVLSACATMLFGEADEEDITDMMAYVRRQASKSSLRRHRH